MSSEPRDSLPHDLPGPVPGPPVPLPAPPSPAKADLLVMQDRIHDFIVAKLLFGDETPIAPDDSLLERGIIDSTGVVEVVGFLQGTFGISIDDAELTRDNLDSIARMARLVARKVQLH